MKKPRGRTGLPGSFFFVILPIFYRPKHQTVNDGKSYTIKIAVVSSGPLF